MRYRVIGLMSGSSLDGVDLAFVELEESAAIWTFQILHTECHPYPEAWKERLIQAPQLSARTYMQLHSEYGHFLADTILRFIHSHQLFYQVQLISSHGHTVFHDPLHHFTTQLGDGAAIAARTGIPVVSDLRAMDLALGGQGAPIVPLGEKLLLGDYACFLNLGGIANLSVHPSLAADPQPPASGVAFDLCPANRVLNLLAAEHGLEYDPEGRNARLGQVNPVLLEKLNDLEYYRHPAPKSLANEFGTDEVYPLLGTWETKWENRLRTYAEHVAIQIRNGLSLALGHSSSPFPAKMLVTGGGAKNRFLVERIGALLQELGVAVEVPEETLVDYKEALIMAFLGVRRWREEPTVLVQATGASRASVGGALWSGS